MIGTGVCTLANLYPPPLDLVVGISGPVGESGQSLRYLAGSMQDLGYGFPRIYLLGNWMNKRYLTSLLFVSIVAAREVEAKNFVLY